MGGMLWEGYVLAWQTARIVFCRHLQFMWSSAKGHFYDHGTSRKIVLTYDKMCLASLTLQEIAQEIPENLATNEITEKLLSNLFTGSGNLICPSAELETGRSVGAKPVEFRHII